MAETTKPQFRIERDVLIGEANPYENECRNVGELILEKLKSKPDFVAEVDAISGRQATFREIEERSVKCAIWLRRQGIRPGDIVGFCIDNNLDTCIPVFATLYVAGVISAWDHDVTLPSAEYFLTLIEPKLLFVHGPAVKVVAEAAKRLNMEVKIVAMTETKETEGCFQTLSEILGSVEDSDSAEVDRFACAPIGKPSELALICNSSGTTGLPKGTEISHRSLLNCVQPAEEVNIVGQVTMWTPTIRWHFGLTLIIEAVLSEARKVISPDFEDDLALLDFIEKYEVTYFTCDPCIPMRLCKLGLLRNRVPGLRKLVISGAPFTAEKHRLIAEQLPHCRVMQCFGMTDSGGLCISQTREGKPGSCGFVCRGVQVKIADLQTGEPLGPMKTGEMWIKSAFIMNGYYKNPEATRKAIDQEGWLHTNDLAYYDQDGEIFIVDRISEFVNYRGVNLPPAEIESVLESHPSVLRAAVVGMPHETDEEIPIAFVTKVPGKEVTEDELVDLVRTSLSMYSHLRGGVKFMEKLPVTSTGKLARKELKALAKTFAAEKSS